MYSSTKVNEEFHPNGKLAYTETIAVLNTFTAHLYDLRRTHPEGYDWIRIGTQAKYYDNGQLAWKMEYNEKGEVTNRHDVQYRKDGTPITF